MRRAPASLLVLLAVLGFAGAVRADDTAVKEAAPQAVPPARSTAASDRPVRVRASHRVDVIAPGERVDTIIDRMRAGATPPTGEAKDRAQVRAPDGTHGGPGSSDQRGSGGRPAAAGGNAPGPPAERPHR